jgi:DNA-binding NtrC family response regulator
MNQTILVVDDEQDFLDSVKRGLIISGFQNIYLEDNPLKAAEYVAKNPEAAAVALIDISMPEMNGVELLELIKRSSPATECIMISAVNDAEVAIECLKKGAYDYLLKPVTKDDLVPTIHRALEKRILMDLVSIHKSIAPQQLNSPENFKNIITRSTNVLSVLKEAELHAMSDISILITGESGTGKDLLARAIHASSPRAMFPFTPVNMTSLPDTLFDAAFHGHVKGSFTGATENRKGYLEMTHRGTLFMDEIGNIPLEFQAKLLRILEEEEYFKLGSDKPKTVNIRFIAATNMDLENLIAKGKFRKDFYYRLKGALLHMPPLRERREDIPLLIQKFIQDFSDRQAKMEIESNAAAMLMEYDYPGNIRELRSIINAAVNLAQNKVITVKCLPASLRKKTKQNHSKRFSPEKKAVVPLHEVEKEYILDVYDKLDKNKSRTAKLLGIGLNTLRRKLQEYGIK